MSDFEVLQAYASWAGIAMPDKLPGIPSANLDVFEDESSLRNRLFYLVPDTSARELRCSFYFEDRGEWAEFASLAGNFPRVQGGNVQGCTLELLHNM